MSLMVMMQVEMMQVEMMVMDIQTVAMLFPRIKQPAWIVIWTVIRRVGIPECLLKTPQPV